MRLGQLSRQVGVSQKEIVSFLQKEKDIELKVHPNVKVQDEFADLIIEKFAKPEEAEPASESSIEENSTAGTKKIGSVLDALREKAAERKAAKLAEVEVKAEETPVEIKEYAQGEEFIRPEGPIEKVETEIPQLEGIKVIGKIDLPQFHKEEPAPDLAPTESTEVSAVDENKEENAEVVALPNATPLFNKRPKRQPRKEKEKSKRSKKPTVSEEERKSKELEKTERQRLAMKKAKKAEARKEHLKLVKSYDTKQKPKAKTKKNPKVAAIDELKSAAAKKSLDHHVTNSPNKPKKEPKSLIGKVWRWMNTE